MKNLSTSLFYIYALLLFLGVGSALFKFKLPISITAITTSVGFLFVFSHALKQLGWRRTLLFIGLTFLVSMLFESVGVATGLIYGPYHYTQKLGPKFLGLVPYLIPIAWFLMVYPSYLIATTVASLFCSGVWWRVGVAAIGGVIMTAWDLAMDPMMVVGGHWVWEVDGAFFGVPLQNFWGWWLTIFVTIFLFTLFAKLKQRSVLLEDRKFNTLAVIAYAITGLSSVLIDFQIGLQGAGLSGLFAMLPWVLIGLFTISRNSGET